MSERDPREGVPGDGLPEMPVEEPRRAASITLREEGAAASRAASMEVANQSLADALRIVYRLLQGVMVALVLLFAFSGFQQVNEGERGLKVTLGEVTRDNLEPGFVFSLPYPLGEVVKVSTGTVTIDLNETFWPQGLDPTSPTGGRGRPSLRPGIDGALLTGDNNIAHVQLSVSYSREDPEQYVRNLDPDFERAVVRAMVERATVQTAAEVTIDDLLRRALRESESARGRENSLEARIRSRAQESIDGLAYGLSIDRVSIRETRPPQFTAEDFSRVNDAVTTAAREREEADREREQQLTSIAGTAYRPLLALIDQYESRLALGREEEAAETFDLMSRIFTGELEGRTIEVGGRTFENVRLSGRVGEQISGARQYRRTTAAAAQAKAETFRELLAQYRANPSVFLTRRLVEGLEGFLASPTTDIWWIDGDLDHLRLRLTQDPEFLREIEREQKRRDLESDIRRQRALGAG